MHLHIFKMFSRILMKFVAAAILSANLLLAQPAPPAPPSEPPIKPAATGLRLPSIVGDHMVLQGEARTPIWGWADPGQSVTVKAGAINGSAVADASGKWLVNLQGLKTSSDPIEITVSTKAKTITLHDVLVGDVWYCAGQSNMEKPLSYVSNGTTEIAQANRPAIRLFKVFHRPAAEPQDDCRGEWQVCTPETARNFSAFAYLFGKELADTRHVPVGLIGAYSGGSWIWSWISLESLQASPETKEKAADRYVQALALVPSSARMPPGLTPDQADIYTWAGVIKNQYIHDDWCDNHGGQAYLDAKSLWQEAADEAKLNNQPPPPALPPPAVKEPRAIDGRTTPTMLSNGMLQPIIPYAIKGVLWYQGESDAAKGTFYRTLLPQMIADWRARWGRGDLPFVYVQLPAFTWTGDMTNNMWSLVQEAQLMTLNVSPNTAMVEAIDIGNLKNIHPLNKVDLAHRAVLAARHLVYGENIVASGPLYDSFKISDDKIHLKFKEAGSGLKIGLPPPAQLALFPQQLSPTLDGFVICGPDMNFVPATAVIDGPDSVTVSSTQVKLPVAARYSWGNTYGNLYNNEDLPASPFRTDPSTPALQVKPPPKTALSPPVPTPAAPGSSANPPPAPASAK
jgi:sialate O-acetylesterase